MTTCKRLTNSSPKLSLITLSLPERRDSRSAEYTGGPVIYPSRFIPGGTRKSIFQVRHGENLKSLLLWMVGIEPTTQKTHGLSTTPFVQEIRRVLVRLTTCNWLTNSSPKLSLTTLHAGRAVSRPVNVGWLPRMGRAHVEVVIAVLSLTTYDGPRPGPARKHAGAISWAGWTSSSNIF